MTEIILPDNSSIFVGNMYDAINTIKYNVIISLVDTNVFKTIPKGNNTIYELFPYEKISIPIFDSLKDFQDLLDYYLLNNYKILVHCHDGISLSPAFIIGYIIMKYGILYQNVYNYFIKQYNKEINVEYFFGYDKLELDFENLILNE